MRKMQFTLRQLLLCVTGFAVWCSAMAQGHQFFGFYGLVVFGVFFGFAIIFFLRMIIRWSKLSSIERGMFAVVVVLSLFATLYLANVYFYHGFDSSQERVRDASRLQTQLLDDSRYSSVIVTYENPSDRSKGEWLWVRGTVASREDLDALHRRIDNHEELWHVEWEVDVAAE